MSRLLPKRASLSSIIVCVTLSAWFLSLSRQLRFATRHEYRSPRDDAPPARGRRRGTPTTPSNENNDASDARRRGSPPLLLLRPSDSIYREVNISTTPIVIEKYKLLLFTIEKVGSTVLRQLMRRMMGYEDYLAHGDGIPHAFPRNGLRLLTQYPLVYANEMLTSDEWTRAMFVRDPKERALSGYLMWAAQMRRFPQKIVEKAERGLLNESLVLGDRGLGKCCKARANGDPNHEVLCLHHMRTFEGFLTMLEEPNDARDGDGEASDSRHNRSAVVMRNLRESGPCPDKHWSPVTPWRMERKFYPALNFVGHLETARWDVERLLRALRPDDAWERYGASGWGRHGNESMFESSSTVRHATGTEDRLAEHYASEDVERRAERIYEVDYDNSYLDLERVPAGRARSFYRRRHLRRFGKDPGR